MAIAAIYAVVADVMLMAELNRLFDRLKGAGGVCRSAELREHPGDECEYEYGSEYCEAGDGVGAAFENLGHTGLPGTSQPGSTASRIFRSDEMPVSDRQQERSKLSFYYIPRGMSSRWSAIEQDSSLCQARASAVYDW